MNETGFLNIFEDEFEPNLRQGDIFSVDLIPLDIENASLIGWILLNADCDVFNPNKTNFYVFAAISNFSNFLENISKGKDKISSLINDKFFEMHFLPPDPILSEEGSYIEFGHLQSIPTTFRHPDGNGVEISTHDFLLQKRIRSLKHLWRVKLAYRISTYFGRPGTPDHNRNGIKKWVEEKLLRY